VFAYHDQYRLFVETLARPEGQADLRGRTPISVGVQGGSGLALSWKDEPTAGAQGWRREPCIMPYSPIGGSLGDEARIIHRDEGLGCSRRSLRPFRRLL